MSQFFKYFENCISKLQNSFFITICILCCAVLYLVAQLCPTLCDPMDCSLPDSSLLGDSPRQEYWSGLPCPPPEDLPNPGIKSRSSALQADSLPSEPLGKRKRHSNRLSPRTSRRNAAPLIHLNFWPPE